MNPHFSEYVICFFLVLGQATVVAVILNKGAAKRWPFLLALCLFDILHNALLYRYTGRVHYRTYFYIYWYGLGLRAFLTLGLLWDVARYFPTLKYVPKRIGLVLITAGITITIGAGLITLKHPHPHTFPLTDRVLIIRQCVTLIWVCFLGSLLASISLLGLGWDSEALDITAGFVVSGLAAMAAAALMNSWPEYGHMIDKLQNCIEIAVLLFWVKTFFRTQPTDDPSSAYALNEVLNELLEE